MTQTKLNKISDEAHRTRMAERKARNLTAKPGDVRLPKPQRIVSKKKVRAALVAAL